MDKDRTREEKEVVSAGLLEWICEVEPEEATEKHYATGCWGCDGGFC